MSFHDRTKKSGRLTAVELGSVKCLGIVLVEDMGGDIGGLLCADHGGEGGEDLERMVVRKRDAKTRKWMKRVDPDWKGGLYRGGN